jgi:hypothetical protein
LEQASVAEFRRRTPARDEEGAVRGDPWRRYRSSCDKQKRAALGRPRMPIPGRTGDR